MSVYCITSRKSVGCTFFDWTMYFLSGQKNFYSVKNNQWSSVVSNPVQEINAHGYPKNHPSGYVNTHAYINQLLAKSQDCLYSVYPGRLNQYTAAVDLNIAVDSIGTPDNQLIINQYVENDFDRLHEYCYQQNVKFIYVGDHPNVSLYYLTVRSLGSGITGQQVNAVEEIKEEFQQVFFKNSIDEWNQLKLTDIWDQRERQALDIRPFHYIDLKSNGLTYPHLWINCQELWYNGEQAALKMLQYLELEIVPERLEAWRLVYAQWQKKQLQILNFVHCCKHIVDSIVNNWYYEIDLTFDQEVVIQHCLIYQHNLNLKTWQLTKFPNNTQDLHKLLEPNSHLLTHY